MVYKDFRMPRLFWMLARDTCLTSATLTSAATDFDCLATSQIAFFFQETEMRVQQVSSFLPHQLGDHKDDFG